jgi:probable F420-dependent oxidoreductase
MAAVLSTNADEARRIGRAFAKHYLALPNYANNLRRIGWSDDDIANDGSDRIIDSVVAWGDVEAIVARVKAHLDGGADHVCVQLRAESSADPALAGYGELASALLAL